MWRRRRIRGEQCSPDTYGFQHQTVMVMVMVLVMVMQMVLMRAYGLKVMGGVSMGPSC